MTTPPPPATPRPRRRRAQAALGDRIFAGTTTGAGMLILRRARRRRDLPDQSRRGPRSPPPASDIPGGDGLAGYIAPLLFGTLLAAVIALLVATPLAVAIALYITLLRPASAGAAGMGYVIDLLAAIPSIVYGFWGIACSPRRWCPSTAG